MPALSYVLAMVSNMSRVSEFYKLNIILVNIYATKFLFKSNLGLTQLILLVLDYNLFSLNIKHEMVRLVLVHV
jgi:hypothetical protein